MGGHIRPIGGEYWFDKSLFNKDSDNLKDVRGIFLSGGQSAIGYILEDLKFKNDEFILVPNYLCPTILYNFKKLNIRYDFYKINEDLSINIESIIKKIKINNIKALFFIDYFGFYHKEKTLDFLLKLKNEGIVLIEDAVQMFWFTKRNKFIGNYVFNSFRKFLPIDGSIVLCQQNKEFTFIHDSYYDLMKKARAMKSSYINMGLGNENEYLKLFSEADKAYYKREKVYGLNPISKYMLNKVDYSFIKRIRIQNYCYVYDKLRRYPEIRIIFEKDRINDNIPLGLPIIINNRDLVRSKLMNNSIYCPVHWNLENMDVISKDSKSIYLSNHILMLPIDNRYSENELDYLVSCVLEQMGVK